MPTGNLRASAVDFLGVFWCGKRAAGPAAGTLFRICAVFISVIRSIRTPVKAHGNYISTRILALAPFMALYSQNSSMMSLSHIVTFSLS